MSLGLKDRIVRYLLKKHGWVSGGEIQKLAIEYAHQTGKTCSRRLQEAVEEGKLDVRLTGRHNHAEYKIKDGVIIPKKYRTREEWIQLGKLAVKDFDQV